MSRKILPMTSLLVTSIIALLAFTTIAKDNKPEINSTAIQSVGSLDDKRKKQLVHMVKQDCGSCHGMTLKGGLGPALLPEDIKNKPILLLKNTILFGRPGTAMPPWQTILTEKEALWISQQLQQGISDEK